MSQVIEHRVKVRVSFASEGYPGVVSYLFRLTDIGLILIRRTYATRLTQRMFIADLPALGVVPTRAFRHRFCAAFITGGLPRLFLTLSNEGIRNYVNDGSNAFTSKASNLIPCLFDRATYFIGDLDVRRRSIDVTRDSSVRAKVLIAKDLQVVVLANRVANEDTISAAVMNVNSQAQAGISSCIFATVIRVTAPIVTVVGSDDNRA